MPSLYNCSIRSRHSDFCARGGESAFDSVVGYACYCTIRLQVSTVVERFLALFHGIIRTTHDLRTGIVHQLWSISDEIVCANVQSGFFISRWSRLRIVTNSHRLRSSEGTVSLFILQFQPTVVCEVSPAWLATDCDSETAFRTVMFVSKFFADDHFKLRAITPFKTVRVFSTTPLRIRPSSWFPRKPGGSGCSVTDVFESW